MKIGLIARADRTGLGIQTHEFFENMHPHKTLVIDLSMYNMNPQFPEWYQGENVKFHQGFLTEEVAEWITDDVDMIFSAECFYDDWLPKRARDKGVATFLQYNAEFLDLWVNPHIPFPTVLMAPTPWMNKEVKALCNGKARFEYLPVPVNINKIPYAKRTEVRSFLHVAGKQTHMDRNGTEIFLDALKYVKTPLKAVIVTQQQIPKVPHFQNLEVLNEVANYQDMYSLADAFVLPRKYGGLCLPLNEAMAAGMPVIMTDCEPQSTFLPKEALVPWSEKHTFYTRFYLDALSMSPRMLAAKMDELYNNSGLCDFLSFFSRSKAEEWSWESLRPQYLSLFEEVLNDDKR